MKNNDKNISLAKAFLLCKSEQDVENFLLDLCTPSEIKDLKERWLVCQTLYYEELSYRQIHQKLGVSLTTIGRVARFLKDEKNFGYKNILNKLGEN
jgi:Trp operon repressor